MFCVESCQHSPTSTSTLGAGGDNPVHPAILILYTLYRLSQSGPFMSKSHSQKRERD
jgi:hypothetical protein